jgi:hypothetical protein
MPSIEPVSLEAGDFTLRPGRLGDVELALAMLLDPDVRQWNPGPDEPPLNQSAIGLSGEPTGRRAPMRYGWSLMPTTHWSGMRFW